jgi:hypothetical protein
MHGLRSWMIHRDLQVSGRTLPDRARDSLAGDADLRLTHIHIDVEDANTRTTRSRSRMSCRDLVGSGRTFEVMRTHIEGARARNSGV